MSSIQPKVSSSKCWLVETILCNVWIPFLKTRKFMLSRTQGQKLIINCNYQSFAIKIRGRHRQSVLTYGVLSGCQGHMVRATTKYIRFYNTRVKFKITSDKNWTSADHSNTNLGTPQDIGKFYFSLNNLLVINCYMPINKNVMIGGKLLKMGKYSPSTT